METNKPFDGYEGIWAGMLQFRDILKEANIGYLGHLTDSIAKTVTPSKAVSEIVEMQSKLLSSLNIPSYVQDIAKDTAKIQWDSLSYIVDASRTPEIIDLQKSLICNDFSGIQSFVDSLKSPHIEAANLAIIKVAPIFEGISLPRGITSAINSLHVGAAKRLLTSESIGFDTHNKYFYVEASPSDRATVCEANILISALELLSDIDEADLISFLTYLEKYRTLASDHPTGKRIREIVAGWAPDLDFDCDFFYHARALREGACPYTESDLRKAPTGYSGHGRFNFTGQSHYYFSDTEKGAVTEVAKHNKEANIQIAKLRPKRSIRMIDLSGEIKTQNKFLEYCRFTPSPEQYPNIKREYLLPCFVADCCKYYDIEGIKYYGSKEYSNYVSWEDSYFDIVSSRIQRKGKPI